MKPSTDRLLELQHGLAGTIAEANQVEDEAKRSHERHDALKQSFYALRARMDAAEFRAGDAKDTDVIAARADFQKIGASLAREMTCEDERLQALADHLVLVDAEIDEVEAELCGNARRGIFWLIKVSFVVLLLAELAGVPVLKTIREGLGNG